MNIRWNIQTKRISIAFLQNSEGSISDGLEFLAFTLQPLLVDVKPYLVSNLELMINPMFFMSIFILFLTLLQLFTDCLVHLLDPLNELVGPIFISFFIGINIFPIHQVQRDLRKIPKTCLEWQTLSGRM
jgi:hypothetical protein